VLDAGALEWMENGFKLFRELREADEAWNALKLDLGGLLQ